MKKLLIVGGGFVGALAAKNLEKYFNVTLIDTKNYFEFTPGILRTIVEPEHLRKIHAQHSRYLKSSTFIRSIVNKITNNAVYTSNKSLTFDYLILASGSRYSPPIKAQNLIIDIPVNYVTKKWEWIDRDFPTKCNTIIGNLCITSRETSIKKYHKKLLCADKVLIIGGGLVGVELAAEIAEKFHLKKITLVHSKDRLMERSPIKASAYAFNFLKKIGIEIILNERVITAKGKIFLTDKKRKIKTDIAFLCTGITPNTEFLKKSFPNSLDGKNYAKVNEFLQLENYQNIFAGGDITNIREEKTAQNAEEHARLIAKNILNKEKNHPLIKYAKEPRIMVISLGKYNGILIYRNFILTGFIPGLLKSLIEKRVMLKYSIG